MSTALRRLVEPLCLAGLFTIGAVALSMRYVSPDRLALASTLLAVYAACFVAVTALEPRRRAITHALLAVMPLVALTLIVIDPRTGTAPVLLVIWTAAAMATWSPRTTFIAVAVADIVYYLILREIAGFSSPLMSVLIFAGFQAFAALCMHYAKSAERARDRLALVNADLLATRALFAESARDAERLRVTRELHDVAGHTLTAMRLNLRALAADPALAGREDLRIVDQLAAELMGELRGVVQALRDTRGLDIATALHALAAPLPKPTLHLDLAPGLQIADAAVAETVLRVVQETLTNAARHAGADTLQVSLRPDGDTLVLVAEDDGRVRGPLREGNGIAGMRERVAELGGTLALSTGARGGLRVEVRWPMQR